MIEGDVEGADDEAEIAGVEALISGVTAAAEHGEQARGGGVRELVAIARKDAEAEVGAAELGRRLAGAPDQRAGRGIEVGESGLAVELAVAAVVVEAEGAIGGLLELGEQDPAADRVHGAGRDEEEHAGDDGVLLEQIARIRGARVEDSGEAITGDPWL